MRLQNMANLAVHPIDASSLSRQCLNSYYVREWETSIIGSFYETIKPNFISWPWACSRHRLLDTVLAKFRSGHVGLNQYLCRIGRIPDPYCPNCPQVSDTIEHFLLVCPYYLLARQKLEQTLQGLGIPILTMKILLGGGGFSPHLQLQIRTAFFSYLCSSRRIKSL